MRTGPGWPARSAPAAWHWLTGHATVAGGTDQLNQGALHDQRASRAITARLAFSRARKGKRQVISAPPLGSGSGHPYPLVGC